MLQRSMLIDKAGFFIGWMPDGLDGITVEEAVLPRNAEREVSLSVPVSEMPLVKIRALSTAEAVLRVILRRPSMARICCGCWRWAIPRRCLPAPQAI